MRIYALFSQRVTYTFFLACLLGMVFTGWDLMLVEPSQVSIVPVEYLWDDRKPSFG
jgi:hypothetical protein